MVSPIHLNGTVLPGKYTLYNIVRQGLLSM